MARIIDQLGLAIRIKQLTERYGLKVKYIAQRCGIAPNTLSAFLNGRHCFGEETLERLESFAAEMERRMA